MELEIEPNYSARIAGKPRLPAIDGLFVSPDSPIVSALAALSNGC